MYLCCPARNLNTLCADQRSSLCLPEEAEEEESGQTQTHSQCLNTNKPTAAAATTQKSEEAPWHGLLII